MNSLLLSPWQYVELPFFSMPLHAQTANHTPVERDLPPLLIDPLDTFPDPGQRNQMPSATMIQIQSDFIMTRGPTLQDPPPVGQFSDIDWNGEIHENAGLFNNETIEKLFAAINENSEPREDALETALSRFEAGLAADPVFFPFLYNAGRIAYYLEKCDAALRYFNRAEGLIPRFYGSAMNQALCFERQNQNQFVIQSYRRAAGLNPFRSEARTRLGRYYLSKNDLYNAELHFSFVEQKDPENQNPSIYRAEYHWNQGNIVEARQWLESVRFLNSDGSYRRDYDPIFHAVYADYGIYANDEELVLRHLEILLELRNHRFFLRHNRNYFVRKLQNFLNNP